MGKIPERVILLYTDFFEGDSGNLEGHPKAGRLYRSVYNEDRGFYKVSFYDDGDPAIENELAGLIISKLEDDNGVQRYKFVEVSQENILSLDIEADDYRKLEEWKADPRKGIEGIITEGEEFDKLYDEGIDEMDFYNDTNLEEALNAAAKELRASIQDSTPAQIALGLVKRRDSDLHDAIASYLKWCLDMFKAKAHQLQNPVLEDAVSNDDNVNIYSALRSIELYRGNPQLKPLLFEAVDSLLLELRRK